MCIVACVPASPDPCRLCYSKLSHLSVLNEFSFLPDCLLLSSPKARLLLPRTPSPPISRRRPVTASAPRPTPAPSQHRRVVEDPGHSRTTSRLQPSHRASQGVSGARQWRRKRRVRESVGWRGERGRGSEVEMRE